MKLNRDHTKPPALYKQQPFFGNERISNLSEKNNGFFSGKSDHPVVSPSANGYNYLVQKQEEPVAAPAPALLTEDQINKAIRYNRFMYPPAQMLLLQQGLHITATGRSDRETALAVAAYQHTQGLTEDGMAGPDTFAAVQADPAITNKDDLILFSVNVRDGIGFTTGGGTTDMLGHFNVEIHLPPGNCDEYEYRQYICGEVEFLPAGASAATPFSSLNSLFTTQPGGALPHIPNFHEDGNTVLNSKYGHRNRGARPENRYTDATGNPDQEHGCVFRGEDFPGINGRITNTGEVYDFDLRFMGEVRHKTRGRVAERWWSVKSTFGI